MAKEFIAAIELGSSKITGIAGKKNLDGSISILAVVQEESSECIRRGVVYNIDKTTLALINIKKRLEAQLQTRVKRVYVGIGGQSILGVENVIGRDLPKETIVTQEMVNELMDANRNMNYPEREILDAITLEYKVDNQYQMDPVGIQCTRLEGNFLNILWRRTFFKNLNKCFENANIDIAEMNIAPLALADSVLVEADRRAGCLLVDLGAETTTIAVYYKNILRHIAVLPIGGVNVTRDIATLQMEEAEAERMKIKYGNAYTEPNDIDPNLEYPIDDERSVKSTTFIEIVEDRIEEIVQNVRYQVPEEYVDKLRGGIILTGGGANMKNIDKVFRAHTKIEKVRIAKIVNQPIDATQPEVAAEDCRLNTAISLLAKGDRNCAGDTFGGDLFNSTSIETGLGAYKSGNTPIDLDGTQGMGSMSTPPDNSGGKDGSNTPTEDESRKNGFMRRLTGGVKDFITKMMEDDED